MSSFFCLRLRLHRFGREQRIGVLQVGKVRLRRLRPVVLLRGSRARHDQIIEATAATYYVIFYPAGWSGELSIQEREIFRALSKDPIPYQAIMAVATPAPSDRQDVVRPSPSLLSEGRKSPQTINEKKPINWFQRACSGFTTAGTTCLKNATPCCQLICFRTFPS